MHSSFSVRQEFQRLPVSLCAMGSTRRAGGRHVREHSHPGGPSAVPLAETSELDFASAENLLRMARTLAEVGGVVIVEYDSEQRRLVFRARGAQRAPMAKPMRPEQDAASPRSTPFDYEDGGSERRSLGSVSVDAEAWWSAELTVPDGDVGRQGGTLFVRLKRHGVGLDGYLGATEIDVSLPEAEVDQVIALLTGLVDQARRDGVVSSRPRVNERMPRYLPPRTARAERRLRLI